MELRQLLLEHPRNPVHRSGHIEDHRDRGAVGVLGAVARLTDVQAEAVELARVEVLVDRPGRVRRAAPQVVVVGEGRAA